MNRITQIAIGLLFILEVLLVTYWKGIWGPYTSSIILFISSLMIGILALNSSINYQRPRLSKSPGKWKYLIVTIISIVFITWIAILLKSAFSGFQLNKMDISRSDVIPLVIVMVERFLDGEFPYSEVSLWGYTLRPTYLPMIWLPFTIAEIFNFDYRWIPFSIVSLGLILLQIWLVKHTRNLGLLTLLSATSWFLLFVFIKEDTHLFTATIENINVGYYLLFCLAIVSRKPVLIGLALGACLMARYSFALWLPFFGIIYLISNYKHALIIVGISAAALMLVYILPFLSQDPQMFLDSLSSYTIAAKGEWAPVWQAADEKPYHLFRGIGFAGLFYDFANGDLLERIKTLQFWHYLLSISISLPMLAIYLLKKRGVDLPLFLVASLKVYFVFFYNFIQVPYSYLMMVPVFVSLVLVILLSTSGKPMEA